jgi:hypothetical protein
MPPEKVETPVTVMPLLVPAAIVPELPLLMPPEKVETLLMVTPV